MKIARVIYALVAVVFVATGCVKDDASRLNSTLGTGTVNVRIGFGAEDAIVISRAATPDEMRENRVDNIYLFVFNSATGELIDHAYFERGTEYDPSKDYSMWSNVEDYSSGEIRAQLSAATGVQVYAMANLSDFYGITKSKIDQLIVADQFNFSDFKALQISLATGTTSRRDNMLMSGCIWEGDDAKNIDITQSATASTDLGTIELYRVDAKIDFKVNVNPDVAAKDNIEFTPYSWRLMSMPMSANVLVDKTEKLHNGAEPTGVASTDEANFDVDAFGDTSGFSFYMLESNLTPQRSATSYADRDMKKK